MIQQGKLCRYNYTQTKAHFLSSQSFSVKHVQYAQIHSKEFCPRSPSKPPDIIQALSVHIPIVCLLFARLVCRFIYYIK